MGTWGTSPLATGVVHSPLMGAPPAEPKLEWLRSKLWETYIYTHTHTLRERERAWQQYFSNELKV
jgi:hypothetical protein